jgi:hypothetical protein
MDKVRVAYPQLYWSAVAMARASLLQHGSSQEHDAVFSVWELVWLKIDGPTKLIARNYDNEAS